MVIKKPKYYLAHHPCATITSPSIDSCFARGWLTRAVKRARKGSPWDARVEWVCPLLPSWRTSWGVHVAGLWCEEKKDQVFYLCRNRPRISLCKGLAQRAGKGEGKGGRDRDDGATHCREVGIGKILGLTAFLESGAFPNSLDPCPGFSRAFIPEMRDWEIRAWA